LPALPRGGDGFAERRGAERTPGKPIRVEQAVDCRCVEREAEVVSDEVTEA
jgi:hypothetical protein